jgi:hypothetical protein
MVKAEQVRAKLEKARSDRGAKRRQEALGKLPQRLAKIGRGLLGRAGNGKALADANERTRAQSIAGAKLDALSAGDRIKVLAAIFPGIGAYVSAAWDLGRRLPYTNGYERKPFRAPRDAALTRPARLQWLCNLCVALEGFDKDLPRLAAWAEYLTLGYSADGFGILFAAALDSGGPDEDAVFDFLRDSAHSNHPVGPMGRHLVRAFLIASRPDGWELIEKMVLAAEGREWLWQTILETIDEAHPEAFRRMLRLILEHDLARFNETVQAISAWFGFQWDTVSARVVNRVLERVLCFLEDPKARAQALHDEDGETVYLALWALAFENASAAVKPAKALLSDGKIERRFAAAYLLGQLQLPAARAPLLHALDDPDLRVALCALEGYEQTEDDDAVARPGLADAGLFERLERLLERLPLERTYLEPIIWPWHVFTADREAIATSLVNHLGKRPPAALIPHVPSLDSSARRLLVEKLAGLRRWNGQTRDALFALAGDASISVREAALRTLALCKPRIQEIERLEAYLTQKANDLRRGVLGMLLKQSDRAVLASANRLLQSADIHQRQGGLEVLRLMAEAKRLLQACRARAEQYRAATPCLSEDEHKRVETIFEACSSAAVPHITRKKTK